MVGRAYLPGRVDPIFVIPRVFQIDFGKEYLILMLSNIGETKSKCCRIISNYRIIIAINNKHVQVKQKKELQFCNNKLNDKGRERQNIFKKVRQKLKFLFNFSDIIIARKRNTDGYKKKKNISIKSTIN